MAVASARNAVNIKNNHFDRDNARIDKYTLADELPAQLVSLNLHSHKMSPAQPAFRLRSIVEDDKDAVLKFLRRFFFLDEPMNKAVKLLDTPEGRCIELEEYSASSLSDGISVAAVDDNGDFVGIILNGIVHRKNSENGVDKSEECPNPKFRRILKVLAHLEQEGRIWDRVQQSCDTVVEVRIVSTHSDWRGRGLMRALCEETERIACEIGAGAIRMDTTSAFSAAAAERLGYRQVYDVKYSELPFAPQPDPPHTEARVYLKDL